MQTRVRINKKDLKLKIKLHWVIFFFQNPLRLFLHIFIYVPVSQDLIGHVDVKTSTAHFYVQRKSSFGSNAVVPFELARLNEGNAFNLKSGIFTVPVTGIYHFEFSGVKLNYASHLSIFLQVNGVNVGLANTKGGANDVATLSASLRLVAGDRVNLYNPAGRGEIIDGQSSLTHFSGWLVEEDLM